MPFLKLFICLTLALTALKSQANNESVELNGKYEMTLTIGNKVFTDYMIIDKIAANPVLLISQNTEIQGSIEVPHIFKSSFVGQLFVETRYKVVSLNFSIVAKENGQEFNVHYVAGISPMNLNKILQGELPPTFYGTASLDNNKKLGEFKAVKIE